MGGRACGLRIGGGGGGSGGDGGSCDGLQPPSHPAATDFHQRSVADQACGGPRRCCYGSGGRRGSARQVLVRLSAR